MLYGIIELEIREFLSKQPADVGEWLIEVLDVDPIPIRALGFVLTRLQVLKSSGKLNPDSDEVWRWQGEFDKTRLENPSEFAKARMLEKAAAEFQEKAKEVEKAVTGGQDLNSDFAELKGETSIEGVHAAVLPMSPALFADWVQSLTAQTKLRQEVAAAPAKTPSLASGFIDSKPNARPAKMKPAMPVVRSLSHDDRINAEAFLLIGQNKFDQAEQKLQSIDNRNLTGDNCLCYFLNRAVVSLRLRVLTQARAYLRMAQEALKVNELLSEANKFSPAAKQYLADMQQVFKDEKVSMKSPKKKSERPSHQQRKAGYDPSYGGFHAVPIPHRGGRGKWNAGYGRGRGNKNAGSSHSQAQTRNVAGSTSTISLTPHS